MGRGDEQLDDRVLVLGRHAGAALAAARLGSEGFERGALDVAAERHGHDHLLALDQVLVLDPVPGGGDLGDSRGCIGLGDLVELGAHHRIELGPVGEDLEQAGDRGGELAKLSGDLVAAQCGEAMQAQLEDGADLGGGQAVAVALHLMLDRLDQPDIGRDLGDRPVAGEQGGAGLGGRGRAADDPDHLVQIGDRDDQAEQQMRPVARLGELELGAPGDHLLAEADERFDDVPERQRLGPAAADREHVGREARLGGRVPPELVEDDVGSGVALQVDDDSNTLAVRFVAYVGNALDALVLGGLGDLLDQAVLADLKGHRGQNDRDAGRRGPARSRGGRASGSSRARSYRRFGRRAGRG